MTKIEINVLNWIKLLAFNDLVSVEPRNAISLRFLNDTVFFIIISVCFAPQSVHRYEHDGLLWIYVCIRATTNRYYFISFISFHWFVFHTHGSQERKRSNDSNANNNQYTLTITSRHLHSHWKCQDRKSHVHGQLKMCCSRTHFAVTTVEMERPNELASVDEQERRFAFCRLNLYACNGGNGWISVEIQAQYMFQWVVYAPFVYWENSSQHIGVINNCLFVFHLIIIGRCALRATKWEKR